MGAPKRNRRKYDKPKEMWDLERIKSSRALIDHYGLKNMKELWMAQTEIGRIRRNARLLLAGGQGSENIRDRMFKRLERIGLAKQGATLDDLLDLKENALLERRLQTIVFRKGLAKTAKQARQLTVHGFISVNGRKVSRPGYIVDVKDEAGITYYKPIDLAMKKVAPAQEAQQEAQAPAAAQPAPAEGKGE
ncbi:MAG: 30S ribosomal protein S4 [Candidatus Micrarchaeota archaeon]|nr:30S ribosomal protein S4 [Candidatus Micrarchaeota archaeon]